MKSISPPVFIILAWISLLSAALAQTPPPLPAGVTAHRDLAYVSNGHAQQKLDLFVPEKAAAPMPLIVWVHGGAWVSGDKADNPPLRRGFVQRGYAVASLNYRLSGAAIFPAQIEDCKAALRWLRAHAKDYNLDPARIGVWGGSAGGHLVALLGTTGDIKDFDVSGHLDQSSAVQAAGDYFGPTDFVQMDAHAVKGARLIHDSPQSPESRVIGGPIQDPANAAKVQRANPITYVTKGDAPFLIVHGDQDPLVPHHQSELLYAALVEAGVPVRFHTIKGAGHGEGFGGQDVAGMVVAFFDLHLLGQKTAAADWPVAMTSDSVAVAEPPRAGQSRPATDQQPARAGNQGGQRQWQRPTWEQFLERGDANQDGKVTRDEFKGPARIFEMLDRNKDGVITKEEHEQIGPAGRN